MRILEFARGPIFNLMTQVIHSPAFLAVRLLFAVLAIMGNLFIIATIQRFPKLRSRSYNGLICILAFSDFVVGVGLLIRTIATIIHTMDGKENYSVGHCISIGATNVFGIHLSQLSMLVIAFDRLYAIISPIKYNQRDPMTYPLKCFVFVLIFSVNGLFFLFYGVDNSSVAKVCNIGTSDPDGLFIRYWTMFFTIVSGLIFFAYGCTLYFVSRGFAVSAKSEFEREYSRQKRVFVTISVVLLSHFLCTVVPLVVITIGAIIRASPAFFSVVVLATGFLSGVNASNNILIYGWKYEELRNYMGQMVRCRDESQLRRDNSLFFSEKRGDVFV